MSGLKAFDIVVAEEYYCEGIVKYRRAVYDKSEADKVIARHKYKRCLAMAELCLAVKELNRYGDQDYMDFAEKWHKRWLELAKKFKPNKEAK